MNKIIATRLMSGLVGILIFCMISCNEKNTRDAQQEPINVVRKSDGYIYYPPIKSKILDIADDFLFIIPAMGCEGCTQKVSSFIVNTKMPNVRGVITGIRSEKEVNLSFSKDFIQKCSLDAEGEYLSMIASEPNHPWLILYDGEREVEKIPLTAENIDETFNWLEAREVKLHIETELARK